MAKNFRKKPIVSNTSVGQMIKTGGITPKVSPLDNHNLLALVCAYSPYVKVESSPDERLAEDHPELHRLYSRLYKEIANGKDLTGTMKRGSQLIIESFRASIREYKDDYGLTTNLFRRYM
tara:strand:+ start:160 stop:519 length:360 start_codon:yes stop_codon:yes gene_type:complete